MFSPEMRRLVLVGKQSASLINESRRSIDKSTEHILSSRRLIDQSFSVLADSYGKDFTRV